MGLVIEVVTNVNKVLNGRFLSSEEFHSLLKPRVSTCEETAKTPKMDVPGVPSYGCYAMIGKSLFEGGV